MNVSAMVKAMKEAGLSFEQVTDVLGRMDEERRERARAGNAKRQAEHRARHPKSNANNGVTGVTGNGDNGVTETGGSSRARVLPWEEDSIIPPDEPNGSSTPKGVAGPKKEKRVRATRLPEDWQPKAAHLELALSLGMSRERYARLIDEYRDYWKSTPGARGTKLDWDATFRNRIREIVSRERIVAPKPASAEPTTLTRIFIVQGTPQWAAWVKYRGKEPPTTQRGTETGWFFLTEWPPDATITGSRPVQGDNQAGSETRNAPEREGPRLQACGSR